MQPYPPFSLISGFCSYARKNRYTTSSIPDITVNDLWFATLGGNYLWLVYLQLNSCHARHTKKAGNSLIQGRTPLSFYARRSMTAFDICTRQVSRLWQNLEGSIGSLSMIHLRIATTNASV